MNTSKKVDSKGLDNLAVKLKDAKFAELNAGDLKTEGCRNQEGAFRSSASDKNLLEKRLKEVKRIFVLQRSMDPIEIYLHHRLYGVQTNRFFPR